VFLVKFISSLSPSKLKGQTKTFSEIFSLWLRTFDLYTQSSSNTQLWYCPMGGKNKTSFNLDTIAEIYGLQTRKVVCGYIYTLHTLGSSWDHLPKHVVPIPRIILHAWNMTFVDIILAHMMVGNTLNQYLPFIHINCHTVGCKPHKNIR